jgi:ATP-dependent RNA helicase RhlE
MEPPTFASLGLSPPLVSATIDRGHTAPTPIQVEVIPAVLRGRDVRASAPTGTGKTASFVLPILEQLAARETSRRLAVLILAPTRELAMQIGEAVRGYGRHLARRVEVRVVFGGASINPQMMALRGGADVVVATPGRLLDLVSKNALSLSSVSTLVLDEADRLLDQGFTDELARILALVPARRQTLLFSATFGPSVRSLAESVLNDPARIDQPASELDTPRIVERAIEVDRGRRTQLLWHLIAQRPADRVLVFVATTYATEHVADKLEKLGVAAAAIHGKLSQGARTRALAAFREGKLTVLVATDVAARGLDIAGLPMVVSYDLPRSPTDYLHRIGRTGRAGASGVAVSFVTADMRAHFRLIEKRHGRSLEREHVAGFEPIEREPEHVGTGGVKGKRKSKKDKLREAAQKRG